MTKEETTVDMVYFCTDDQCVDLHSRGMNSRAVTFEAFKTSRLTVVALVLLTLTLASSFVALFVALRSPRPMPSTEEFQAMILEYNTTRLLSEALDGPNHSERETETQESVQMWKGHVEDSSFWAGEIQALNSSVHNVSSQIQMLHSHLQGASANIQEVKGELRNAKTWSLQTQTLRSSLEGSNAEIQRLKEGLKTANDLHAQTQSFLRTTSENTNHSLSTLSRELQKANADIQMLRVDLARANAQALWANRSLEIANTQILFLRDSLDNISLLKTQSQALSRSLQGANAMIQSLKDDLKNTRMLMVKVQEEQNRVSMLNQTLASQELQQRKINENLQLLLQGWKAYRRYWYYFSNDKKSWHGAEQFCVSQGGHLTSVTSQEEQDFITKYTSAGHYWIGLTDMGVEGRWRWADGTRFSGLTFWASNQPDNWKHWDGQTEDCVHVQKQWNDIKCSSSYPWVCKKPMRETA